MFLKNCWYVAAWDHEHAPLAHFRRTLDALIAKEQALKITAQAAAPVSVPAGG